MDVWLFQCLSQYRWVINGKQRDNDFTYALFISVRLLRLKPLLQGESWMKDGCIIRDDTIRY